MSAVRIRPTAFTRSGGELRGMLSRFRGKCETCHKPINRGSPIGWSKRAGANHAACVGLDGDEIRRASMLELAATVAELAPEPEPERCASCGRIKALCSASYPHCCTAPSTSANDVLAPRSGPAWAEGDSLTCGHLDTEHESVGLADGDACADPFGDTIFPDWESIAGLAS